MSTLKAARLKARIIKIGLAGRLLIFVSIFLLKYFGYFRHDTFRELTYIMWPLAAFYCTLFFKYTFKMAYKIPVGISDKPAGNISLGYYGLLILNIIEIAFIACSALGGFIIEPLLAVNFIRGVLWLEMAFGILAGMYIVQFFTVQNPDVIEGPKDPK